MTSHLPLRIANARGVPGTAGAVVRDRDGVEHVLVTHHVAFGDGAVVGDRVWALPTDTGDDTRVLLGRTRRGELGRVTTPDGAVFLDCALVALAELSDAPPWLGSALAGLRAFAATGAATPGLRVCKHGATTGTTIGTITDAAYLDEPVVDGRRYVAAGQLLVCSGDADLVFAAAGDSGAAIVDDHDCIVGLLWGATGSGAGIAAPIRPILDHLGVQLWRPERSAA